jgi:hypothetical protein
MALIFLNVTHLQLDSNDYYKIEVKWFDDEKPIYFFAVFIIRKYHRNLFNSYFIKYF